MCCRTLAFKNKSFKWCNTITRVYIQIFLLTKTRKLVELRI